FQKFLRPVGEGHNDDAEAFSLPATGGPTTVSFGTPLKAEGATGGGLDFHIAAMIDYSAGDSANNDGDLTVTGPDAGHSPGLGDFANLFVDFSSGELVLSQDSK